MKSAEHDSKCEGGGHGFPNGHRSTAYAASVTLSSMFRAPLESVWKFNFNAIWPTTARPSTFD